MLKVWGKTVRKNKIIKSHMVEKPDIFSESSVLDCVDVICEKFDIERPIVLNKHRNDMREFALMRFFPEDFMEKVDFDKFEVEIFVEKKK